MKLTNRSVPHFVQIELGRRIAGIRLNRNITQSALARSAGVGKSTLERLETGVVATRLSAFIRICCALNLVDRLEAMFPEPGPSPVALMKLRGKERRRASGKRQKKHTHKPWTWGDEKQ